MTCAHTLGKVDHPQLTLLPADHQVELVEITVHQSRSGETDDELHAFCIELSGRLVVGQRPEGVAVDKRHEDRVARVVDGCRDGEASLVEDLESSEGDGSAQEWRWWAEEGEDVR